MNFEYFSRNGVIRPIKDAVISLSSIEYSYGFGVYETLRVLSGRAYFFKDHVERLIESARTIGLEHSYSKKNIEKYFQQIITRNEAETCNVKMLLIGASNKEDAQLFIICLNPLFPDKKLYRDGVSLITYGHERVFPHAKTLNMLQSYLAYRKAKTIGAYDALLYNNKGFITEGTRTNFLCIKDKVIFSPPEKEILLGVTRKVLIKVAKDNGYIVKEKNLSLGDISDYDGAFITSTSSKIVPVKNIDDTILNPRFAYIGDLMDLFDKFLAKCKGNL